MIRLLVGAAGVGKTRLGAELAQGLLAQGWNAGFLQSGNASTLGTGRDQNDQSHLLVVDYAPTLSGLADDIAEAQQLLESGLHIKVLLLARAMGDWWESLPATGEDFHSVHAAVRGATALDLEASTYALSDPLAHYRATAEAFAAQQGLTVPADLPTLDDTVEWSFLLVSLAALDAVGTPDQPGRANDPGRPRGPSDLLDAMLHREAYFWRKSAATTSLLTTPLSPQIAAKAVLALSLVGAVDETDAAETLRRRVPDLADASSERLGELARWIHSLYPPDDELDGWTSGIQPDLLNERFVMQRLIGRDAESLRRSLLQGLEEDQAERALTIMARAMDHHGEASGLLRVVLSDDHRNLLEPAFKVALSADVAFDRCLASVLADVSVHDNADLLEALQGRLPPQEGALRHTAVAFTALVVEHARGCGDLKDLASALTNHSARLLALDVPDEARATTMEALGCWRELEQSQPGVYTPALARALNNASTALARSGYLPDGLEAALEAVQLRERLHEYDSDAYRLPLAKALTTLGNRLSAMAEAGGGRELYEEAAETFRRSEQLYQDRLTIEELGYALTLSNQARVLVPLAKEQEGLERLQLAERIYRRVAENDKADLAATITVYLARTLTNIANICQEPWAAGSPDKKALALRAAREADGYYRQLVADYPGLYEEAWAAAGRALRSAES